MSALTDKIISLSNQTSIHRDDWLDVFNRITELGAENEVLRDKVKGMELDLTHRYEQVDQLKAQVNLVENAASLPDGTRATSVLIYLEDWDAKKNQK